MAKVKELYARLEEMYNELDTMKAEFRYDHPLGDAMNQMGYMDVTAKLRNQLSETMDVFYYDVLPHIEKDVDFTTKGS